MGLKIGIIGFGGMAHWHASNAGKLEGVEFLAAYDVDEQQLVSAEKEFGMKPCRTLDELLNIPEINFVLVATPNQVHKELVIAALRAGKNVMTEKPATLSVADWDEMVAVSRECGKLLTVHQNRRWDKDYRVMREVIENGTIGKVYSIESRVFGTVGGMYGWRAFKEYGGGMVLDWGVHLIDQIMNMIPEKVVSVYANLFTIFSDEVDDNIKIMLRFENGVSALLEMSTNCFVNLPRWHVSCENGTAVVEDWSCKGRMVQLNTDAEMAWDEEIVYTEAGPTRTMAPRPAHTLKELPLPEVQVDWSDYYKNIVAVLDGKAELIVKPEQALRVMKVIDTIFESDSTGKGIACSI